MKIRDRKAERLFANRFRLSKVQTKIEIESIKLRSELGIDDFVELPLELAKTCLPNCEIIPLGNLPDVTLDQLIYAHTKGYNVFEALAKRVGDSVKIIFNDAHHPLRVRANVMEEICHVRFGHRPDIVSIVPVNGNCRTYNELNEKEASGCGAAALVPLAGLEAMLKQGLHMRRIAEHFGVLVDVVEKRISATNMGNMMNAQFLQYALMPG